MKIIWKFQKFLLYLYCENINTGAYPLSLIHRRKGNRLHAGSIPATPTKRYERRSIGIL